MVSFATAAFLSGGCGGGGGSSAPPAGTPTAAIEATPPSGTVPLAVTFDGSTSFTSEGTITGYAWDFGDGATATGPVANHTYSSAGTFNVHLVVTGSLGYTDEAIAQIVVTSAGGTPTAVIAANAHSGLVGLTVSFSSAASVDPGGAIVSRAWSFGDGGASTAASPAHTFNTAGVFTVTLTVTDNSGLTGQDQTVIAVASWDQEVVRLTNEQRWSYLSSRLAPLKNESHLAAAALRHSTDMAQHMVDYIDHVGTDGSTLGDRIADAGYTSWTAIAENIAAGQSSPAAVVTAWMGSAGHRANIMNSGLRELGASYVNGGAGYVHYWTQDFGTRSNSYPVVINREAIAATSSTVELYIHGAGWAQQMQVSNSASFTGAVWEAYAATKAWTLTSGLGTRTVYVKLKNGATELTSSDSIVVVEP